MKNLLIFIGLILVATYLGINVVFPVYARRICSNELKDYRQFLSNTSGLLITQGDYAVKIWEYSYKNCLAHYGVKE